jgi:hypothetical protein
MPIERLDQATCLLLWRSSRFHARFSVDPAPPLGDDQFRTLGDPTGPPNSTPMNGDPESPCEDEPKAEPLDSEPSDPVRVIAAEPDAVVCEYCGGVGQCFWCQPH